MRWSGGTEGKVCMGEEKLESYIQRERGREHIPTPGPKAEVRQSIDKLKWRS